MRATLASLVAQMRRDDFLLLTDTRLPSLATLVAGERIRGSWWGHPRAHAIFRLQRQLEDHSDALMMRFVDDKLAFVHRHLWPAVLAVASSRREWQTRGLTSGAARLLATLEREGEMRASGPASRELESRWLAHGHEIHTETGAHARHLETWQAWADRTSVKIHATPEDARLELEKIVGRVNEKFGGRARLPWQGQIRRVTRSS
jgi:hypothetical protein